MFILIRHLISVQSHRPTSIFLNICFMSNYYNLKFYRLAQFMQASALTFWHIISLVRYISISIPYMKLSLKCTLVFI